MLELFEFLGGVKHLVLGLIIAGFGVAYVVMGNWPGRLISVALVALGVWTAVSVVWLALRHEPSWLDER